MKREYVTKSQGTASSPVPVPLPRVSSTGPDSEHPKIEPESSPQVNPGQSARGKSFFFFPSRGISSVFSKRFSTTTYAPAFGGDPSRRDLLQPDLEEEPKLEKLELGGIKGNPGFHGGSGRKSRLGLGLLVLLVLVAAVSIGLVLSSGNSNSSGGSSSSEPDVEEPPQIIDFCEDGDEKLRGLISETFKEALAVLNSQLVFEFPVGVNLRCIPDKVFGDLNDEQKEQLKDVQVIKFNGVGLEKIAGNAFDSVELPQVSALSLQSNQLSDLPDDLLVPLGRLIDIRLTDNKFEKLNSDVFRKSTVQRIFMNTNPLLEIPNALAKCKTVNDVRLKECTAMINFEEKMLAELPLDRLDFTKSGIINVFDDVKELAAALGVNEQIFKFF